MTNMNSSFQDYIDADIELLRLSVKEIKQHVAILEKKIDNLIQVKSKQKGQYVDEFA